MAIAWIQNTIDSPAGSAGSDAKAFASNVTAGSLLLAFGTCGANTTHTFTGGGTWQTSLTFFDSPTGQSISIGYCMNATGGATTVTDTYGASSGFRSLIIAEFSGAATTSALDVNTAGQTLAGSTTPTDASITTTGADLVVSCCIGNGGTLTAGAGFTAFNIDASTVFGADYLIQTVGAAITGKFANTSNVQHGIRTAAFKPAGGAAAAPAPAVLIFDHAVQRASYW